MSPRRGFTLIELLVVVAILALLIAILLPSLSQARALSRRAAGGANLHAIGRTYGMYQADWDNVVPLCLRAYTTKVSTKGAMGVNDSIQRIGHWSYQNLGQWLACDSFRCVQEEFALSKVWVSPGTGAGNPFALPIVYPGVASPPGTTYWQQYHNFEDSPAGSGKFKWLQPGNYKGAAFMSYLFFAGDPGNASVTVYYSDAGLSTPYTRFDKGYTAKTRFSQLSSSDILVQDVVMQEPGATPRFNCNYTTTAGFVVDSFGIPGASGWQGYVQGFAVTDSEATLAGGNVLYADGSASWVRRDRMEKVYYKSTNTDGAVTTLYVGQR